MKKFFEEFKKFITRGNVVDMAVGVIVGSSFTAIVNGLSNFILKPLINALLALLFGANSLSELHTFLITKFVADADGNPTAEIDLANSIYIDWGSFINAVINFFLVALVLFTIVKLFNKFREEHKEFTDMLSKGRLTKAQKKELKEKGINKYDRIAVGIYFAEKKKEEEAAAAAKAAEEAEKARLEREANPTTEDLLKQILAKMDSVNADKN